MGYNKKNRLRRIVEVQDLVLQYQKKGKKQIDCYHEQVYPRFMISYSLFNIYLTIPAKSMLKKIKETERVQMKLF